MQTTMIRTNGSDLLEAAQKALAAQKGTKSTKGVYGPPVPEGHEMAMLHKVVGKVHENHNAAIHSLATFMDKPGTSPIEVYTGVKVLNAIFGMNTPKFATFINRSNKA